MVGKYGQYPMSLLRNNGNGTFDDVTEAAGLMSLHPTQTAAWADFDDGGEGGGVLADLEDDATISGFKS
jgi:hypothetical protein